MALSQKSLVEIAAKAKDEWKKDKNKKQKKLKQAVKSKSTKKKKRRQMIDDDNPPPIKKQKKIDYILPLSKQKKRSVIKLENIATGMEKRQMFAFFKQFGSVTRSDMAMWSLDMRILGRLWTRHWIAPRCMAK